MRSENVIKIDKNFLVKGDKAVKEDYPDFEIIHKEVKNDDSNMDREVLPVRDHSKLGFPHIEHKEIQMSDEPDNKIFPDENPEVKEPVIETGPRGQDIINGKVLLGRGVDLNVPLPIYLPVGRSGNYEPVIDKSGHTGPGKIKR